jgi:hypothetical protein
MGASDEGNFGKLGATLAVKEFLTYNGIVVYPK